VCVSGYPVASAALLGAGQGQGTMWSTRRLNDMDPCPWSATRPLPTRRDTRAAGDPPLSGPALGHPGAEDRRRRLRLIVSLGICLPCQVLPAGLRWACTLAYRR
jgi:hypothetical protein